MKFALEMIARLHILSQSSQPPGKSAVGGGILAIAPGKGCISVWSPGLDAECNSHLGQIALEILSQRLGWSILGA